MTMPEVVLRGRCYDYDTEGKLSYNETRWKLYMLKCYKAVFIFV